MPVKKQHYIPQLHLRRFSINNNNEHIYVLDKTKARMWKSAIVDVAEEKYFYKLNISEIIKRGSNDEQYQALDETCLKDLGKRLCDLSDDEINKIDFSVETYFSDFIEPRLKSLTDNIIANTYNGNRWVIENCNFISEKEKSEFSWLLAKEFIRTKHHRDRQINSLKELRKKQTPIIAQFYGQEIDENTIDIFYSKEQERLLHANEILDDELANSIAGVFNNHIWVLLENFTKEPFCCPDNLFALFPTEELPAFYGYGFSTYGMIILYPISANLTLVMLERTKFGNGQYYQDKRIISIDDIKFINNINIALIVSSYRYVFFSNEEAALKYKEKCEKDEKIRVPASFGRVS